VKRNTTASGRVIRQQVASVVTGPARWVASAAEVDFNLGLPLAATSLRAR
jgi:hypothetical protein